jgi:hypothetical protein
MGRAGRSIGDFSRQINQFRIRGSAAAFPAAVESNGPPLRTTGRQGYGPRRANAMNYHSNNDFPVLDQVPIITGYNIAFSERDAIDFAFLAGELFLERKQLVKPRVTQLSRLCGISRPYVNAAIAIIKSGDPDLEMAARWKHMSLLEAAVLAKHPQLSLAEMFATSSPVERAELAKTAGPAAIWDELVAPFI